MYARVITAQYQPGKADGGLQLYRDALLPETRQRAGFKGALGLIDNSTGKAISITLWETEADMKAGESSRDFQEQLAKLVPFFATAPLIESYEVAVQE